MEGFGVVSAACKAGALPAARLIAYWEKKSAGKATKKHSPLPPVVLPGERERQVKN